MGFYALPTCSFNSFLMLPPEHWLLPVELVEVMVLSIIGQLETGNDDFCQFLFPYELINQAFEVIQSVSWRGMLPDFLVIFAAMAWLGSLFYWAWAQIWASIFLCSAWFLCYTFRVCLVRRKMFLRVEKQKSKSSKGKEWGYRELRIFHWKGGCFSQHSANDFSITVKIPTTLYLFKTEGVYK